MHQKHSNRVVQALLVTLVLLSLVAGVGLMAASVNAQETTTTAENVTRGEQIQPGLTLVESSYDGSGAATLTFRAERSVAVTITDAGAFGRGGEIPRRTVVLEPGTRTIEMPVTEGDGGLVGVTIGTNEVLYAEPIRTTVTWFEQESTWGIVQVGALGGATGVLAIAGVVAWRLRSGGREEVERIA